MSSQSQPSPESITIIEVAAPGTAVYTLEAAAHLSGLHPDMLRYYCQIGLLGEKFRQPETEVRFDDNALYELGWIEYYRNQHGVNRQALSLIIELRRDLQRLQEEVRFLRGM